MVLDIIRVKTRRIPTPMSPRDLDGKSLILRLYCLKGRGRGGVSMESYFVVKEVGARGCFRVSFKSY